MADTKNLKILLLEDNPSDVELIKLELDEADIKYDIKHVFTKFDFLKELEEYQPEIILADYTIPNFSGTEALSLAGELSPEIPLVIVTGTIDEETAVNCMKAGAVDYVLKGSLKRLPSAIKSSLEKRKLNKEKKIIEDELVFSLNILEHLPEAAIVINTKGELMYWNKTAERLFGYQKEDSLNNPIVFFETKEQKENFLNNISKLIEFDNYKFDEILHDRNNIRFWASINTSVLYNQKGIMMGFLCTINNITERKEKELFLKEYKESCDIIFSYFPDIILRLDKNMNIIDIKMPSHLEFLRQAKHFIGKNVYALDKEFSFLTQELMSQLKYFSSLTFKTGYIQSFDTKFIMFNNLYNFEIRISLINEDEILLIIRDITTQNIKDNSSNNNLISGSIKHTLDGKIISISNEIVKILGFETEKEIINKINIKDIYADKNTFDKTLSSMIINETINNLDINLKTKNNKEISVTINSLMIKDKARNSVYFEVIVKYIENYKSSDHEINYLQNLETINRIVSDTAYKLNSIISSLNMSTYILKSEINSSQNQYVLDNIKELEKNINQLPEVTSSLLNFNQILKK